MSRAPDHLRISQARGPISRKEHESTMPTRFEFRSVLQVVAVVATAILLWLTLSPLTVLADGDASDASDSGAASESQTESEPPSFLHPLDNEPVEVPLPEGKARTEAVVAFHETGMNPYDPEVTPEAVAEGEELYDQWCASCHEPDGSGRIGPSLIDDTYRYERTDTDVGKFEIIYFGGAGAMQSFETRISQDGILKIIAYIEQLRQEADEQD